jgi:hypothetical protein
VQASQDPDAVGEHNVEQRVRKAWDERAAGFAVRQGAGEGMFGDEMHDEIE